MAPGVRRVLVWINGFCVVALLAAGITAVLLHEGEPRYPDAWDPRVVSLVQFVERERGYTFKHPVVVDFLTAAEYSERTRTDEESLAAEDVEDLKQGEALLRAFGLITSDVDLLETVNDLSDTGTLAYYDSLEERVTVRGTEITPELRATLVHELTHVLQDQSFDLDRFGEDDEDVTDGQVMAFQALAEGDAGRIEHAYVDSLSEEEQEAINGGSEDAASEFEEEGPSQAVAALFAAAYILGDPFVELLETVSRAKVDEAFLDPPKSEEHVLDPFAYLDGDQPRPVATPSFDGADVRDDGDFGAASLLVVLAERIDVRQALKAVTGWGGDAYAVFEKDGRTCARVDVTGDTPADTDELDAALRAWSAAAPRGSATSTRQGDLVELESCDPGAQATAGSGGAFEALGLAQLRSMIAIEALDKGAARGEARCYSTTLVDEANLDEVAFERALREAVGIAKRCRIDD